MASGSTRTVLAQMQLAGKKPTSENDMLKTLKVNKIPLKNPTPHNHSK